MSIDSVLFQLHLKFILEFRNRNG